MTGSLEALTEALRKLERDDVKLSFVQRGVGGITKSDVQLAAASNATIIGFNVRPDRTSRELAMAEDVEIRTYEIIYQVLEDIENALLGLLAPEFEEVVTGEAEVREIFSVPRVGKIAGCYVTNGVITRDSKVRFLREGTIIWKGTITRSSGSRTTPARCSPASSAASACPTSRTSSRATSSRPSRSARSRAPERRAVGGVVPDPPYADGVHAAALRIELYLRECRSLKAKRALIRPDDRGARPARTACRCPRSATTTPGTWPRWAWRRWPRRRRHLGDVLDDVERFVWSFPEVEVLRIDRLWIEEEETT